MARRPRDERAQAITDAVYERAKAAGHDLDSLYPATLKRVRELVEEVGDPDQVELVCLAVVRLDGPRFVAYRSLTWGTYEWVRDTLDVPEGAWSYALWAEHLPEDELRDSAEYWLRRWYDG